MNDGWPTERIETVEESEVLAGLRRRAGEALRETFRLLRVAVELMVLLFLIALPWLFRAMTVAFAAWAISCTYPVLSQRLGGDPPAAVLALTWVLLPLAGAFALAQVHQAEPWGAFLAAAVAIYVVRQLAVVVSPPGMALAMVSAFAGIVMHFLHQQTEVDNAE